MKKSLTIAALFAAAVFSTTPGFAADMAMGAPVVAAPAMKPICFILPLMPDCIAAMKAHHDAEMADHKGMMAMMPAMPAMPMMPHCVMAEAGAGHLMDCSK